MRKKLIEGIAYKLDGRKISKSHIHIINSQLVDKYILFDFYTNKCNRWAPDFRVVIGPTEFENCSARTNMWNEQRINYLIGEERYYTNYTQYQKMKKLIEVPEEVRDMAAEYFTANDLHSAYYSNDLISQIEQVEFHIYWEYKASAEERRYKRIQDKMAELEPLPKDFKKFLADKAYKDDHYLYFSDEKTFCSRCGRVMPAGSYKHNQKLSCPKCRKKVTAKSYNRMIAKKEIRKEILMIHPHGDEIVLRYVKTCLLQDGEKKESLEFAESVRTYHQNDIGHYKGKYIHYYDNMVGGDYWNDKMNYGIQVAYGRKSVLYTNNWDELTEIVNPEWLDLMRYWSDEGITMPLKDFLMSGRARVQLIEKLYKAGLKRAATEMAKNDTRFSIEWQQNDLRKILGINKPLFNYAQRIDAAGITLRVLQDACIDSYGLSNEEIIELTKTNILASELAEISKGRKLMKTLHYLQKSSGYENLRDRFTHYRDYIDLAKQLQYDLDNDTVRYPKDIEAAHNKAATEISAKEMDEKIKKALSEYPHIGVVKDKLEKDFGYKDKNYEIIAPENAGDIILEGRTLHHCVGGDFYLNKHNTGKTYILFLRKLKTPDIRYYTIEIDPYELKIVQYYGAYDKKPDKEEVDKFLKKWKGYLMDKHYIKKEAV